MAFFAVRPEDKYSPCGGYHACDRERCDKRFVTCRLCIIEGKRHRRKLESKENEK